MALQQKVKLLKKQFWPIYGYFKQSLPSIIFQETFPKEEF